MRILETPPSPTDRWRTSEVIGQHRTRPRRDNPKSNPCSGSHSFTSEEHRYAYSNTEFEADEGATPAFTQTLDRNSDVVMRRQSDAEENKRLSDDVAPRLTKSCTVPIQRSACVSSCMEEKHGFLPPESISEKVTRYFRSQCSCSLSCFLAFITSVFPVVSWIPEYKVEFILPDVIAGFTVSILHIPQGMAYGILASLNAENGLYVSFFPVLIYFLLGTSKHVSIGTFALISLMTSSAIANVNTVNHVGLNSTHSNSSDLAEFSAENLEIATSLALVVGFWQLFLGIFRLGSLSVVLSDHLVSGFTTGAAFHVATSQLGDLFGISIKRYTGPLKLIYMYGDLFTALKLTNFATLIISAVSIFVLACTKEQINERFKDKLKMPIPIDLVVVIVATLFSYLLDFSGNYSVKIMGYIPTGVPKPTPPRLDFLPQLLADSFAIAIVVFAISLSMAKLFAKKHHYDVRANQELVALGCANVFSSFFACYPCSASLSRSLLQERAGGKTQMAGVVSCCILLLVLLVLAPLFYTLPRCILAAVIIVALKGMFLQVKDFLKAWRISKIDAMIWLVTIVSTLILDISYGLLAGVLFAILTVIIRTVLPSKSFLGNIAGTELYLDIKRYSEAKEIRGVKIFRFQSALYFMNREAFKDFLERHVPLSSSLADEVTSIKNCSGHIRHIIIDCSSFSYIDASGLETLQEIMKQYQEVLISVHLAECSASMYDIMERAKFFDMMPKNSSVFSTVHDAVQYCCHN